MPHWPLRSFSEWTGNYTLNAAGTPMTVAAVPDNAPRSPSLAIGLPAKISWSGTLAGNMRYRTSEHPFTGRATLMSPASSELSAQYDPSGSQAPTAQGWNAASGTGGGAGLWTEIFSGGYLHLKTVADYRYYYFDQAFPNTLGDLTVVLWELGMVHGTTSDTQTFAMYTPAGTINVYGRGSFFNPPFNIEDIQSGSDVEFTFADGVIYQFRVDIASSGGVIQTANLRIRPAGSSDFLDPDNYLVNIPLKIGSFAGLNRIVIGNISGAPTEFIWGRIGVWSGTEWFILTNGATSGFGIARGYGQIGTELMTAGGTLTNVAIAASLTAPAAPGSVGIGAIGATAAASAVPAGAPGHLVRLADAVSNATVDSIPVPVQRNTFGFDGVAAGSYRIGVTSMSVDGVTSAEVLSGPITLPVPMPSMDVTITPMVVDAAHPLVQAHVSIVGAVDGSVDGSPVANGDVVSVATYGAPPVPDVDFVVSANHLGWPGSITGTPIVTGGTANTSVNSQATPSGTPRGIVTADAPAPANLLIAFDRSTVTPGQAEHMTYALSAPVIGSVTIAGNAEAPTGTLLVATGIAAAGGTPPSVPANMVLIQPPSKGAAMVWSPDSVPPSFAVAPAWSVSMSNFLIPKPADPVGAELPLVYLWLYAVTAPGQPDLKLDGTGSAAGFANSRVAIPVSWPLFMLDGVTPAAYIGAWAAIVAAVRAAHPTTIDENGAGFKYGKDDGTNPVVLSGLVSASARSPYEVTIAGTIADFTYDPLNQLFVTADTLAVMNVGNQTYPRRKYQGPILTGGVYAIAGMPIGATVNVSLPDGTSAKFVLPSTGGTVPYSGLTPAP